MILTAFMHNFFAHFHGIVAKAAFGLTETSRMKRFVFSFVSVFFKWFRSNGRMLLRLYTSNTAYLSSEDIVELVQVTTSLQKGRASVKSTPCCDALKSSTSETSR